jgi:hypothetical protein
MQSVDHGHKPRRASARPLAELLAPALGKVFARRGFASSALVTRWPEIAGTEIAQVSEPLRVSWSRLRGGEAEPGLLVLRVEGPVAIEIQHLSGVIVERINRFLGWRAVDRIAIRQAPLERSRAPHNRTTTDRAAQERIAATLTGISDDGLRDALARLGAALGR